MPCLTHLWNCNGIYSVITGQAWLHMLIDQHVLQHTNMACWVQFKHQRPAYYSSHFCHSWLFQSLPYLTLLLLLIPKPIIPHFYHSWLFQSLPYYLTLSPLLIPKPILLLLLIPKPILAGYHKAYPKSHFCHSCWFQSWPYLTYSQTYPTSHTCHSWLFKILPYLTHLPQLVVQNPPLPHTPATAGHSNSPYLTLMP